MPIKLITEKNLTKGIQEVPIYVNEITDGIFMKLVLASIWIIAVIGSYYIQKKSGSQPDFHSCVAVGGFILMMSAIILRLIPGFVDGLTLAVTIIIGLVSILWFLFAPNN